MIKLGSQEVTKIMKGSTEIATAYRGSDEVWSSGGAEIADVRLLLLGGGGSGGIGSSSDVAGGGGAGGYLEGTTSKLMAGVKYRVVIGLGGAGDVFRSKDVVVNDGNDVNPYDESAVIFGGPGSDTSITDPDGIVIANAGGGGKGVGAVSGGYSGASTGGANLYIAPVTNSLDTTKFHPSLEAVGVLIKGNKGGTGVTAASNAGGGAGAGQAGQNATTSRGGYGGNGFQSDITGTLTYYAGGGGGGTDNYANGSGSPSRGGAGGGGAGAWWSTTVPATKGEDYLGAGGGGGVGGSGTNALTRAGAAGGQGAVYIKTEAAFTYTGSYDVVNNTVGSKAYRLRSAGDLYLG